MKKVIFVCLLSLSACLSQPASEIAPPTQTPHPEHVADAMVAAVAAPDAKAAAAALPAHNGPARVAPAAPAAASASAPAQGGGPATAQGPATAPKAATAVATDSKTPDTQPKNSTAPATPAKTDTAAVDNKTSKDEQKAPANGAPAAMTPASNATKTDDKNATLPAPHSDVTSAPHGDVTPTAAPHKAEPTLQARGFDGPSFMGGIILTLGLLAIGFMGFKYYKNQTERNYHTL